MIIGLVGPEQSITSIEKSINNIDSSIMIKHYSQEKVNGITEDIEQFDKMCDAIIFTGCAVCDYVTKNFKITKSYTYIGRTISSVVSAFVKMLQQGMELDSFSIDVVEEQVVLDLLDAFEIDAQNIYSSPFSIDVDEEKYVKWHMHLLETGKTNIALTSFVLVYKELKKNGYNVIYLPPTRSLVREALDKIKKDFELNRAEYSMISVELLKIADIYADNNNYYSQMLKKTEAEKLFIKYVQNIQGAMFPIGLDEYIIFSNSGNIKTKQNYDNLFKLKNHIKKVGFNLIVGIGVGVTAYKAELNARKSVDYSLKNSIEDIVEIDENDELRSFSDLGVKYNYKKIVTDKNLLKLSEKTGLSLESISKIINISEARQSYVFNADELADCLNITIRSARRIINKIVSSGYGNVIAKETSPKGGRPKAVIEFDFYLEKKPD